MGGSKSKSKKAAAKKRGSKSPPTANSQVPEKKANTATLPETPDVDQNANRLKREHPGDPPNANAAGPNPPKTLKMDGEPETPMGGGAGADVGVLGQGDQLQEPEDGAGKVYSEQNKMLAELRRERLHRAGLPDEYEGYKDGYKASTEPWDK